MEIPLLAVSVAGVGMRASSVPASRPQ
jgi:hypothetical protein